MTDEAETEPEAVEDSAELESATGEVEEPDQDSTRGDLGSASTQDGGLVAAEFRSYQGPLPNEEWFEHVEKLHPGATELILEDFKAEREHQREMQIRAQEFDLATLNKFGDYQLTRIWIAGFIAVFVTGSGLALILLDKAVYGFVLLIAEVATLAGAFLATNVGKKGRTPGENEDLELTDEGLDEIDRLLEEADSQ